MTSAYIHIPFCEHICFYCDFNKVFIEGQPVDEYIQAVLKEIDLMKKMHPSGSSETIYIGGGTPTSLTAQQLDTLLEGISKKLPMETVKEYTIEANPGDLTIEKMKVLKNYGINRLSMGVQTFDDQLLKKIGRKHTAQDVFDTMKVIEEVGMENVSIDLIYALPGQTMASFQDTLEKAISLQLPHYSLYSLILENKTIFYNLARQGRLHLPDEEIEGDMFEKAAEFMEKNGRNQYEVSNFSIPGKESKHNLVYWNNEHYYAFGAGASGYLGNLRYKNHGPIQHYLQPLKKNELPIVEKEALTIKNQMEEEMFLGLRKKEGVSLSKFQSKFGKNLESVYGSTIDQLEKQSMIVNNGKNVSLTEKGLILGNEVFEKFLLDK